MQSRRSFLLSLASVPIALAACGSDGRSSSTSPGSASASPGSGTSTTLRLGYFPNITHAPALVGVRQGLFAKALGASATLDTSTYNSGTQAVEALFADAIDASYLGPNPAINGYAKSGGKALRIVAGATSGGAFLVVKPEIATAADLKGRTLATPQLGQTQDVALRTWLKAQGFTTNNRGGGDVSIIPQDNSASLDAFKTGDVDGGWLPEPWATRLVQEGGAKVLVDERTLWPAGRFVTTHLAVATKFLDEHPDIVTALLQGELDTLDHIAAEPAEAQQAANAQINAVTQKPLKEAVIAAAWSSLSFTADPIASSLQTCADHAQALGLLDKVDLGGIYALDPLNALLQAKGLAPVKGL